MILSPYVELYHLIIPTDNRLRQINELVDFSFVYDEFKEHYCLDNDRNAIDPIRMFKYLLLKAIFELSDVDIVDSPHTKVHYNHKSPITQGKKGIGKIKKTPLLQFLM